MKVNMNIFGNKKILTDITICQYVKNRQSSTQLVDWEISVEMPNMNRNLNFEQFCNSNVGYDYHLTKSSQAYYGSFFI